MEGPPFSCFRPCRSALPASSSSPATVRERPAPSPLPPRQSEYPFNRVVTAALDARLLGSGARVVVLERGDDRNAYASLPARVNDVRFRHPSSAPSRADVCVELHFNASATPEARGCEMLHASSSKRSADLARRMAAHVSALGFPLRHASTGGGLGVSRTERGGTCSGAPTRPAVIAEPFFGSSPRDWAIASADGFRDRLADAYAAAIMGWWEAQP